MNSKRRTGFSHVECLVVAGIAVLIMSTLLPAVQRARESARRTNCKSRMKKMALALHNYHDVYNLLPPAWISKRDQGQGHLSTGWMTSILPYVDHAALFNKLEFSGSVYTEKNKSSTKSSIPEYLCPSGGLSETNSLRGGWGTSHYAAVYGPNAIPRWSTTLSNSTFWPGNQAYDRIKRRSGYKLHGLFGLNFGGHFTDVVDGTSNTFMIGEKSVISGGAIWPGPRSNFHESDVLGDTSYSSPMNRSESGFSSRHAGGAQFILADGSVRFISQDIDSRPNPNLNGQGQVKLGVYQYLGAINDGVSPSQF